MIKIVHIGLPLTGVGTYIRTIISNINDDRFESVLICGRDKFPDLFTKKGVKVKVYKINFRREINPIFDFTALNSTINIIKKENPQIIHAHSSKCGFIGRLAGWYMRLPVLYTPNAFSYLSTSNRIKRKLYKILEIAGKKTKAKILASSRSEANRALKDLKYNPKDILIWNNSIKDIFNISCSDQSRFKNMDFICTIGRPSFQKNHGMLINAFEEICKKVNNIKLVIIGAGYYSPDKTKLESLIAERYLENKVYIIDHISHKKALCILKQSKLFISSSRYEGLPFSVLESMALGKPCVLTKVDGNKDCVEEDKNGFLIQDFDHKIMAEKIIHLLQNHPLREKMGAASREIYIEKFDISKNIANLEQIYLNAIRPCRLA